VQEAQAGQSRADFISKYNIALKEAREALYWLRLLDASGELSNGACKILLKEGDENCTGHCCDYREYEERRKKLSINFTFLLLPFSFTAPWCLRVGGDDESPVRRRMRI
jgi:hypothetical protein